MDIKLTGGDLDITSGELTMLDGTDAIAQHLSIRLKMFKGEWFLNTDEGMPYYENILVKNPKIAVVVSLFKKAIQSTPGVAELLSIEPDYDPDTRTLSLDFAARTTEGETLTFSEFVINV